MRICASSDLCRSCPTSRHRLCWSRRWWARSMRASCLLSSTRMACSPIGPATPHLASTFFVNTISAFFLLHTLHPIFCCPGIPMRCASMHAIMYMCIYIYILKVYTYTYTFIYRSCYSTPCIDLASHGFIVFAVLSLSHTHTHKHTHAHTTP